MVKEPMVSFKNVQPDAFKGIKQGMKQIFRISEYPIDDENVIENFDIVSLGSKFTISYYKTGTLLLQGDETSDDFQLVERYLRYSVEP